MFRIEHDHWITYEDSEIFANMSTPQSLCEEGTTSGFSALIATAVVASPLTSTVAESAAVSGAIEVLCFRPSGTLRDQGDG